MKKKPDRLYVDKDDIKDYKLLKEEGDSPFCNKENKDIFIMAMITGFRNKLRKPLAKKEGFIREEYLNDEDRSIIKAIAISEEEKLIVLLDMDIVFQIAEEYASGGIKYLKDSVFGKQHGNYAKRLESELLEVYEKLDIASLKVSK